MPAKIDVVHRIDSIKDFTDSLRLFFALCFTVSSSVVNWELSLSGGGGG